MVSPGANEEIPWLDGKWCYGLDIKYPPPKGSVLKA
jgi:hypothetical protein